MRSKMRMTVGQFFRHMQPFLLVDEIANHIEPNVGPILRALDDETFTLLNKVFNLLAMLAIHFSFQYLAFVSFLELVVCIAVFKKLLTEREQHIARVLRQSGRIPGTQHPREEGRIRISSDDVEKFFTHNHRPTLSWLNTIISTMWLNYRALATHLFMNDAWPKIKEQLQDTALASLEIHQFSIGDRPFRVDKIYTSVHKTEVIVDVECAYDGNANIAITLSQEQLNISIPVTLENFSVSNVKLRIVLKNFIDKLPLISGCQLFFLESPKFDWKAGNAAKVTDLPLLESMIKSAIDNQIIRRFVLPNRLAKPFKLPENLKNRMEAMGYEVSNVENYTIAAPIPLGVVKVTVVQGEGLRPTDLSFQHYKTSKNLNPLRPKEFALSEMLPKRSTGTPYCQVTIGTATYRSDAVHKNLNPDWNFTCYFPIEYFHGQQVNVEVYDRGQIDDNLLGKASEKLNTIFDKKFVEDWYNLQIYQGRVKLRFELIGLEPIPPNSDPPKGQGVLSLFLGKLSSKYECRPTCHVEFEQDETMDAHTSLNAFSSTKTYSFDEGKLFMVNDVSSKSSKVTIKIWDEKGGKWIGEKFFRLRRLLDYPMSQEVLFQNPFNTNVPVKMFLHTIMYSFESSANNTVSASGSATNITENEL